MGELVLFKRNFLTPIKTKDGIIWTNYTLMNGSNPKIKSTVGLETLASDVNEMILNAKTNNLHPWQIDDYPEFVKK